MSTKTPNFFSNNISLSPSVLRLGIVLALIIYGVFGYLDLYAMPSNYAISWIIRYAIISPLLVIAFLLSYYKPFYRYSKLIMFLLLTFGQLGLIVMIGFTAPEEMAFQTYYGGLIIVMLWASFIFRINFLTSIYIAVSTIIMYNLTALYVQDVLNTNNNSFELSILLNNNFFLISSAVLVLIGAYQFEKNVDENKKVNSELKKEQKQLKQAKEKAEESDRLKSAFLANMSHEIRTPMNGILGFSEILKAPNLSGEKQQEYISIIEKSGERLLNIINDIISISKIESGEMMVNIKESNINDQMDFIYNFFKPQTEEKGINFSYNKALPYNKTFIKTDKEKVYAILTNLVKNAIKFTDKGSIEIGYFEKNNFLTFYVKDTGIGIPKNRQNFVFDRFVQADISDVMARQGAGLGLSISKAYVEMLGGKIWLDTADGDGSIFYFTLPYNTSTNSKENLADRGDTDFEQNSTKNYKLLIAEDDETSEMFISILVEKFAREKISVKNGLEAVDACMENLDIDLILMDMQMPEMNGYEATRKIREFNKDVVIIALTAYALSGDKEKALKAGCNDYITKPVKRDELNKMIANYLEK